MEYKTLKVKESNGRIIIKKKLEAYQIIVLLITFVLVALAGAIVIAQAMDNPKASETVATVLVIILLVACIGKLSHFFIGKITVDPLNRILYVKKISEEQASFNQIQEITLETSRGRRGAIISHLVISITDNKDIYMRMTNEKKSKEAIKLLNDYVKTVKEEI